MKQSITTHVNCFPRDKIVVKVHDFELFEDGTTGSSIYACASAGSQQDRRQMTLFDVVLCWNKHDHLFHIRMV